MAKHSRGYERLPLKGYRVHRSAWGRCTNLERVFESNTMAGRWYKKTADHFRDVAVVWEAEVNLAYMYLDDRLPRDDVQAYMWFAIVGSSVDPPEDEDIRRVARHMTKAQIAQAQHLAQDWIARHTRPANSTTSPPPPTKGCPADHRGIAATKSASGSTARFRLSGAKYFLSPQYDEEFSSSPIIGLRRLVCVGHPI